MNVLIVFALHLHFVDLGFLVVDMPEMACHFSPLHHMKPPRTTGRVPQAVIENLLVLLLQLSSHGPILWRDPGPSVRTTFSGYQSSVSTPTSRHH